MENTINVPNQYYIGRRGRTPQIATNEPQKEKTLPMNGEKNNQSCRLLLNITDDSTMIDRDRILVGNPMPIEYWGKGEVCKLIPISAQKYLVNPQFARMPYDESPLKAMSKSNKVEKVNNYIEYSKMDEISFKIGEGI